MGLGRFSVNEGKIYFCSILGPSHSEGLTCFGADFQGGSGSCMLQKRKKERKKEKKEWLRIYREKAKRLIKAPDTARFFFVHDAFSIMD